MSNNSKTHRAWLWLAAMLCAGLAANPAPASAQTAADPDAAKTEVQQFEDWTLRCQPASDSQPRGCRLNQQVVATDSGKPVLQFAVGRFGPEKILGAVIFVPIGVRLPPGLGIQVDERPLHVFHFEICDPQTCQARAVLEGELLKDLKAGLIGHVKFQNAANREISVPISLKGFTAALRALP
jgi:invasion protein IalB